MRGNAEPAAWAWCYGRGNRPKRPLDDVRATPLSGARFLDFPQRSPYTGPVFKLSVRLCEGRRASAGRLDGRRRSRFVAGRVLPALHPPLGLSSPWDDPGVRSSEDTGMPTGTIARLLIDKGFGFIRDESGIEHFFHRSSVRGAVFELLREGQRVEFTPEESGKGPRAGEVRLIEG
jgi:cold shock protein